MRSTSTVVATFQNTRVCHGPIRCSRPAVDADDGDLVGLGLDRLEQLGGEIGPRRLEHGVAIGRELGAHDLVQLDRELARRIEQRVAAGLEHPLEPAVARQEGALAILHRHAQRQKGTGSQHVSFVGRRGSAAQAWLQFRGSGFRTRTSRENGGPGLEPALNGGRTRSFAAPKRDGRTVDPTSARAVSAPAQSRSHGVEGRARSLSADRPDRD